MSYKLYICTDNRSHLRVNRILFLDEPQIMVTGRNIQPIDASNELAGHLDIPLELGHLTRLEIRDSNNRLIRRFYPNNEVFIGFAFIPTYV